MSRKAHSSEAVTQIGNWRPWRGPSNDGQDYNYVLTRSIIFSSVWGFDFGSASRSLEVYVGYLRRKLEQGGEPRLIHTVHGFGYRLEQP